MTITKLKVVALGFAAFGLAVIPSARAEEANAEEADVVYMEQNEIPADVWEEMGMLTTDELTEQLNTEAADEEALAESGDEDALARRRGGRGWRGDRNRGPNIRIRIRPGRGGWDRGPRWDWGRNYKVCFAQDRRGRTYRAGGYGNRGSIQWAALRACRYNSPRPNSCRAIGCR